MRYLISGVAIAALLAFAGCAETEDGRSNAPSQGKAAKSGGGNDDGQELTAGQRNALRAAERYLELTGISKRGLIDQLSSPAGDGYSKADARFAANNVDADWKKEAVESARNYLDLTPMSEQELYEQLSSAAGEQFTPQEARYAVEKVYK